MPAWSLPASLVDLLVCFRGCFTAPTFKTFTALAAGFLAQPGPRTVTGMLTGARLVGRWHHSRAHRFFSHAHWSPDQLGLVLLDLIGDRLLDPAAPLLLVVDDTLYRRAGRKVWGATWHHDPLAPAGKGRKPVCWATCWVVVGVGVHLPFVPDRAVCLPLLARLWRPRQPGRSKLDLACELVGLIAARVPDRRIHLVCDAAYAGKALAALPAGNGPQSSTWNRWHPERVPRYLDYRKPTSRSRYVGSVHPSEERCFVYSRQCCASW
jgi:hypothetical protein